MHIQDPIKAVVSHLKFHSALSFTKATTTMVRFLATLAFIACSILGIQAAAFPGSSLENGPDTAPNCTFDHNWCGWTTAGVPGHGWLRVPGADHYGRRGWYIIFNGTIRFPGQFGQIVSPAVKSSRSLCFNFWLSTTMSAGSFPNKLEVFAHVGISALSRSYTLDTKSRWTYQTFKVATESYHSVSFSMKASKPSTNTGYIAVDDIRVVPC